MSITNYSLQIHTDWNQLLFGVYWNNEYGQRQFYLGPISLRFQKIPPLEEFFEEGLKVLGEDLGHSYVPDSEMNGKFVCEDCGDVAYNVPRELLN